MNLKVAGKSFSFENNENIISELINTINSTLSTEGLYFSHMDIDGKEIYEEFDEYLFDHVADISNIEVMTLSMNEFIGELIVSLNNYTKRATPELRLLVDQYYRTESSQNWLKLDQLIEGIDWIFHTIKSIDNVQHRITNWDEFIKISAVFEVELPTLLEAIEKKDSILIADIIQYEILPQFEQISKVTDFIFQEK